ncbi:MAG TPA: tetratricopeptide repeat protein [Bryobacteraceae bacterium]|nr:tetratricopeptide repeat protein [Bryobacteraceae bacterium]
MRDHLVEDGPVISKQFFAGAFGAALLFIASCSRTAGPAQRIAILPAEVLVPTAGSQNMATAIPLILQTDLTTSRKWLAVMVPNESAAYQSGAKYVLRIVIEEHGQQIKLQGVLTDSATQKNHDVWTVNGPINAGFVTFGNALAKKMDSSATIYSTKSDQALLAYVAAMQARQPQQRIKMLQEAVHYDPAFGQAYLTFVQTLIQNGVQNFAPLVKAADAHRASFTPLDQARFAAMQKQLSHAPLAEQATATQAVLKIAPNDVPALATLGSEKFLLGDVDATKKLLREALALDPDNLTIRKELADVLVNTGERKQGLALLAEYALQKPQDTNAKRALGELQFSTGRFSEADKTLSSLGQAPGIENEVAICRLLEGDVTGANAAFDAYLNTRQVQNNQFSEIGHAVWMSVEGQRDKAIATLANDQFSQPDLRALALSQIAIWKVEGKELAGARQAAAQAVSLANAQVPKVFASMASLLADGDAPLASWRQKVQSATLDPNAKQFVLGYGFYLFGHYPEAADVWRGLVKQTNGADGRSKVMLAASLEAAGKTAEAKAIHVALFFPNLTGGDPFAAINFTQMLKVNGVQEQTGGQRDAGARLVKLAQEYGK